MPKVEFEGAVHEFPEGFSEQDISQALSAYKPVVTKAAVVAPVQPVVAELPQPAKRTNFKYNNLKSHMADIPTPEEQDRDDLNPANFAELEREIQRTMHPKIKATLVEEHNRLKSLLPLFLKRPQ